MNKNRIERFTTKERVLHWVVALSFFTLVLSGLGLFSQMFNGYFNLFGGGQNAIMVHKLAALIFFVTSLMMFFHNRAEITTLTENDWNWIRKKGCYLTREDCQFNMGKFNPGQKLFALCIAVATVILGITGIFIWFPTFFPRIVVQLSLMLHGLMFICALMFSVVHVYLGSVGNPGTLESMLWGNVTRTWAKHHHARWYKENFEKNR